MKDDYFIICWSGLIYRTKPELKHKSWNLKVVHKVSKQGNKSFTKTFVISAWNILPSDANS